VVGQSLITSLQEGVLVDRRWFKSKGFGRTTVDYYRRTGKLEAVSRGVYRKPGPPLKWQNVVYSLKLLGFHVHIGHMSALQYYGYQHYLKLNNSRDVCIYCGRKLPSWIGNIQGLSFNQMDRDPFPTGLSLGLQDIPFGTWDWPIPYSTPERAFIELMSTITFEEEIVQAQTLFESAVNLRPKQLQLLLEACTQVKAKRLFLWLAKKYDLPWYGKIEKSRIDLGTGKRQIVTDGVLDKDFLIAVPKEQSDGQEQPLF